MGYTNYLEGSITRPENFPRFAECVRELLKQETKKGVRFAGWDGTGVPVINNKKVTFNGKGNLSNETCAISLDNDSDFVFCKTRKQPYDTAVYVTYWLACLILGKSAPVHDADDTGKRITSSAKILAENLISKA